MSSASATSRLRLIPILTSQVFGIGCGIAGVKLNSSLIPPDTLGVYGIFLTFAPIGMWVVHAGLTRFTVRHWAGAPSRPNLIRSLTHAWARRLPWLALTAAAGALALSQMETGRDVVLAISLFVSSSLLAAAALAQGALQAEGAHWKDCATSVSGSLSRTFAPPLLFTAFHGAIAALWLGFMLHALIIAAVGAWALRAYWKTGDASPHGVPVDPAYRGPLFIALAAATWVLAGINRWVVASFFGEIEAGYFTLLGGAAVVLTSSLGAVFVQYFQPGFFQLGDEPVPDRRRLARRVDGVALTYTGASLGAVLALTLVAPLLVGPLIDPRYREALRWIVPAGCFGAATITTVFYQSLLLAGKRERACGPVELSTAALLVSGCVVSAAAGLEWFVRWLMFTPLLPWILTRTLARHYLLRPDAVPSPSPAR